MTRFPTAAAIATTIRPTPRRKLEGCDNISLAMFGLTDERVRQGETDLGEDEPLDEDASTHVTLSTYEWEELRKIPGLALIFTNC